MKTKEIEVCQRKTIYGIGQNLGICEAGNKEDDLHLLIIGITGKSSVKELSYGEADDVIRELRKRQCSYAPNSKKKRQAVEEDVPGMMTPGQKSKVWALMYSLIGADRQEAGATPGERLCAIIKKELDIDCVPKDPFRFLDYKAGNHLIEVLKGYVRSAAKKCGV